MTQRALVLANPIAGRGRGRQIAVAVEKQLSACGFEVMVALTSRNAADAPDRPELGPAARLARQHANDVQRVVAIGGDGTIRETIEGLATRASEVPVAFVPLGNANVVAQELCLPRPSDLSWVASDSCRTFDVGRANGRLFLAMISVGFDASVTEFVDRARHRRLGGWIYRRWRGADSLYILAGFRAARNSGRRAFRIEVDGEPWADAFPSIWVTNTRSYAKNAAITPRARTDDGLLDVHACRGTGVMTAMRLLVAARKIQPASAILSRYGQGRTFAITATDQTEFVWQADGDLETRTTTLNAQVLPGYARLVVPNGDSSDGKGPPSAPTP